MKKSLLCMAIASSLIVPAVAMADATLYGSFRMAMAKEDNKSMSLDDDSTRIGLRGTVDLGLEDTKGIFRWEQALDINSGALVSNGGRYAWLGATGSWGTLTGGKQDAPIQALVTAYADDFNSGAQGGHSQVARQFNRRQGNTLVYASPKMNGLQASASAVFAGDDIRTSGSTGPKDRMVDGYSLGLAYDANNLYFAGAFGNAKSAKSAAGSYGIDQNTWGLAAGFKVSDLTLKAKYVHLEDKTGGSSFVRTQGKANEYVISASYAIDRTTLMAEFGQTERKPDNAADLKGRHYALGIQQRMGRGRVYAEYHDYTKPLYASRGDKFLVGYRVDF
ncbi:porin [Nitrincola alkalisediminis]|uniref:porin n=1 Tax=Nitrincola alkalisediminis TaxID=1366656 RepID=UPI001874F2F4|nr:porin [Nitrincola alkalisediminis]